MVTIQKKHVHIFDYFLDGQFLEWKEIRGNIPVCGQYWVVDLEDDTQIVAKVLEVEPISETECRIMLGSC
ncbi:MAG: hypothetical protein AAGE96_10895 [Cyanobacteria bacterium P01_G01_bin.19]